MHDSCNSITQVDRGRNGRAGWVICMNQCSGHGLEQESVNKNDSLETNTISICLNNLNFYTLSNLRIECQKDIRAFSSSWRESRIICNRVLLYYLAASWTCQFLSIPNPFLMFRYSLTLLGHFDKTINIVKRTLVRKLSTRLYIRFEGVYPAHGLLPSYEILSPASAPYYGRSYHL